MRPELWFYINIGKCIEDIYTLYQLNKHDVYSASWWLQESILRTSCKICKHFFFFQHCLVTVNQTNSGWRNCYGCRCMKRLYSIWHKQSSELAHTTFSKTIWAFGGCFSALKPDILSNKLSYSQHSGWCCRASLESVLVDRISSHSCHPAANSAIYLFFVINGIYLFLPWQITLWRGTGKSKQFHQQMSGQSQKERNENPLIGMNGRYSRGNVSYLPLPAVSLSKPAHLQLSALR